MDIEVSFPGGKRVDARLGGHVIHTDQPPALGGEGSAPAPFELYLASLAACAGIYALGFCQARGISTEGLSLRQRVDVDPETKLPTTIGLEVTLPPGFPEKYRPSILRVVEGCLVKKSITHPPEFKVALSALPRRRAMCSRTTCHDCKKPTYRGCGMHVEQVLGDVPRAERCRCREEAKEAKKTETREPSVLGRLWPFSPR